MRRCGRVVAAGLLALAAAAPAAADEPFPRLDNATQIDADCRRLRDDLAARGRALEQADDGPVLPGLDRLQRRAEALTGPLDLLAAVHPAKPMRDAAERCSSAVQGFFAGFLQNRRVHARLLALVPADAVDAQARRDRLDAFEDAGIALAPAARRRAREINRQLTRLTQDFERRVREERRRVALREDELAGVPEAVWRGAPRDAQGRVLLGLDYPTLEPVLQKADRSATRERLWRAANARGGVENLQVLARLADLRREYARLFGLDSYADFVLRRRMAGSAAAAAGFLDAVRQVAAPREREDLALLREDKARLLGTPSDRTVLQRWDVDYHLERVRRAAHAVDQEALRVHFPPEASLRFVFALAQRLFGVRAEPLGPAPWHPEAQAFRIVEAADGKPLGTLYVDLYPRPDKYGHAAMWPVRSGAAGVQPVAALVANLDRHGLTLDELETLLHEAGHALHALLGQTRYALHGGTNVLLDFVEAPSQMLETWVYDPAVQALFVQVCAECTPIPRETLERAARARDFAKGYKTARQLLFAGYDLALYGPARGRTREAPMALWTRLESATPLGHVAGSRFPASFDHIAGGYAAGYYAYQWSLAQAEDLRSAFAADKLDAAVGRRYRDSVLAPGGELPPAELMRRFLGRPASNEAYFRWLRQP